jgi:predicted DNA-binding transcriptional regulator AlpA
MREGVDEMTKRLLREPELMEYLGVGRSTARRFGAECGAIVRFGRRIAYDREVIDAAIDQKTKRASQAERNTVTR